MGGCSNCKECCASIRGCLSNAVIGTCATLYLLLGVAIACLAIGTFFTPFGQIVDSMYAVGSLGFGIVVFIVGCIGLCAACENKQRVCTLYLFMLLTLAMAAASVMLVMLLFQYEDLLKVAGAASVEEADVHAAVNATGDAVSAAAATVVMTLTTNAFYACGAVVNATGVANMYTFACHNDEFSMLQATVNDTCTVPGVNTSDHSVFSNCYAGGTFPTWEGQDPFGKPVTLTPTTALATLNTPKGLFCACSSTIIDAYVLPYLEWAKWVPIVACVFFLLVFCACVHQLFRRGCCGGKDRKQKERSEFQPDSIQMTYPEPKYVPEPASTKGKKGKGKGGSGGYIARP